MTTKREQVLLALAAAIGPLNGVAVTRNVPLVDMQAEGAAANIDDGGLEQTDAFLNGRDGTVYEFTASPSLMLAVCGGSEAERDAAVDAMLVDLQARIVTMLGDGLGDLVTDIRPQPADYSPREFFGAANSKSASITIELDYWSTSSLG